MINFFNKYKIIFYFINICLIFIYLFPGSIFGCIFLKNCKVQPQITPDLAFISSNHFYVFVLVTAVGFQSFAKKNQTKFLIVYLVFLSMILEIFHLIIPERSFQWSDLFRNLLGVITVILINNLINKYGISKK